MKITPSTDVAERAKDILRRSRIQDFRGLSIEEVDHRIILHGYTKSFYHKQLAQELIRDLAKGRELINHIQVRHALPDLGDE